MKRPDYLKKATTLLGAAALTSLVSLPVLAQVNRPGVTNNRNPQPTVNQRETSTAPSALDREFIMMAAQGNHAEIQTSRLALQKSTNPTVRSFAQQMIQEHTLANQRLSQVASQYRITLPTAPSPLDTAIAQRLSQLSGVEFDRAYMGAQENAHLRAIALYRTAISQGQAPEAQRYASELLPNINNHFDMANRMLSQQLAGNSQRPLQ